jgi:hypothetical protein
MSNIKVQPATHSGAVDTATDEINSIHYPIYKVAYGALGVQTPVDSTNPLPVVTDKTANQPISFPTDSVNFDAFGRLRTSGTGQRLDIEFIYNKQDDLVDESTSNGTVTFNGNSRDLTLSLSDAVDASHATMRSHPAPYTPGNSQLIDITGVLDLAAIGSGTAECFLRSSVTGSVVETTVEQSAWDSNTTGVDWTDSHIFSMDFQSLKVGRIRFCLVQDGLCVLLTSINNDNVRNTGYWQMPMGGAYWRIYNTATDTYMEMGYGDEANAIGLRYKITANASATMKAICCTAKSEGGLDLLEMPGFPRSADNHVTVVTASTTLIPLISIRPKTTYQGYANLGLSLPKTFSITATNPIKLVIIHDAVLTGESWGNVDTADSMMEFDVAATAVANGHEIYSDYIATERKNTSASKQGLLGKSVLWNKIGSPTGVLTIAAIRTGTSDADCLASIQWEEIR